MLDFDPSKIKLVVSDLDGTLLNGVSALGAYNIEKIKKLKDKGIMFTFATGRMDKMTWHFASQLDLELPIISCNGAMMRYNGHEDYIYRQTLNDEQVRQIITLCDQHEGDFVLYGMDTVYHAANSNRVNAFHHYNEMAIASEQDIIETVSIEEFPDRMPPEVVTKGFVVFKKGEDANSELGKALAAIPGITPSVSGKGTIDLMPDNTSKGMALEYLCETLGIGLDEVITVGDQQNDISMLERSGISIGMRSGAPIIRPHVDFYAENNNADGLGRVLQQVFSL